MIQKIVTIFSVSYSQPLVMLRIYFVPEILWKIIQRLDGLPPPYIHLLQEEILNIFASCIRNKSGVFVEERDAML